MLAFGAAMLCGWSSISLVEAEVGDIEASIPSPVLAVVVPVHPVPVQSAGHAVASCAAVPAGEEFLTPLLVLVPNLLGCAAPKKGA